MGIDFVKLIGNLGINAARLQKDTSKIDTKTELNTYVSGWDAIKAKAESENKNASEKVDISALESEMKLELAILMGADFGETAKVPNKGTKNEPYFSEEDISLENMMALLEPEDGLDINKLREENKKQFKTSKGKWDAIQDMNEFGFDSELTDIIMDECPGAVEYISDAIKSGSAGRITKDAKEFDVTKEILYALKKMNDPKIEFGLP